jgi:hypothetical protein
MKNFETMDEASSGESSRRSKSSSSSEYDKPKALKTAKSKKVNHNRKSKGRKLQKRTYVKSDIKAIAEAKRFLEKRTKGEPAFNDNDKIRGRSRSRVRNRVASSSSVSASSSAS